MPIPAVIHFITVSQSPTAEQIVVIEQAKTVNPDFIIRVWTDEEVYVLGSLRPLFDKARSGAQRADIMRIAILLENGGIYLDTDMVVRRNLKPLLSLDAMIVASQDGQILTNAFFGAPARHPALCAIRDDLLANEPDWSAMPSITTGPGLFTRLLHYRSDVTVLPRESFYPYNYDEEPLTQFKPATLAVHEWAGSWLTPDQHKRTAEARRRQKTPIGFKARLKNIVRSKVTALLPNHLRDQRQPTPVYDAGDHLVARLTMGPLVALDKADLSLTPNIATTGHFEPKDERFAASVVQGGDYVIDVGANIGLYSLLAAQRCGPFGRVFAFEPNPDTASLLRRSAIMNWFHDRIKIIDIAVSDTEGQLSFEGSSLRRGDFRVTNKTQGDAFELTGKNIGTCDNIIVPCTTLDNYFPYNIPIKFMKVDAEGHEVNVLRGAQRLLKNNCIDILMIEYGYESHIHDFAIFVDELRNIERYGYTPYRIWHGNRIQKWDNYESEVYNIGHENLVFISPFLNKHQ